LVQREELQLRLGVRIRDLRQKRGWTQDVFADKSGFHRAQVGAFERGEMNLTLASLHLLAQTLGVRVIDLFRGIED
jgi:transcriptional regulator with XRE-family HTH domain